MVNLLRENDVESDNEITLWAIGLVLQLCHRVGNNVACERSRHSFTNNSKLSGRSDYVCWSHIHFSIIQSVHCYWLHLNCFNKC